MVDICTARWWLGPLDACDKRSRPGWVKHQQRSMAPSVPKCLLIVFGRGLPVDVLDRDTGMHLAGLHNFCGEKQTIFPTNVRQQNRIGSRVKQSSVDKMLITLSKQK